MNFLVDKKAKDSDLVYNPVAPFEWRFVLFVSLVTLILASFPYITGYVQQTDTDHFLGINTLALTDMPVYFSLIEQAREGHVLVKNLYTSEPQHAALFHPLWFVLGVFSRSMSLSPVIIFHLSRILTGIAFLWFFYYLIAQLFREIAWRRIAFLLLCFSSGVGGFFLLLYPHLSYFSILNDSSRTLQLPTDVWIPESNTFLTLMHSPLFILAQLLTVGILFFLFRHLDQSRIKSMLYVGALMLVLGFVHPYDLLTIYTFLFFLFFTRIITEPSRTTAEARFYIRNALVVVLFSLVPLIWYAIAFLTEPALGLWAKQNVTMSPHLTKYVLGYGMLFAFAAIGTLFSHKLNNRLYFFLLTWAGTLLLLMYLPILQVQRRYSNTLHIALVLLAAFGLRALYLKFFKNKPYFWHILPAIVLAVLLFSTNAIIIWKMIDTKSDRAYFYEINESLAAYAWLKNNTQEGDIILSSFVQGNRIPAFVARPVYLGHRHQTIHAEQKYLLVQEWFFKTNDEDDQKQVFLKNAGTQFVWYGPFEKALGYFQPQEKSYLHQVFQQGSVTLYKVL